MKILNLSTIVAERYKSYLSTTFYFRDADLRRSFNEALEGESLVRGPYLEATGAFKLCKTPRQLAKELNLPVDEGFLAAIDGDRPLYKHQEQSIRLVNGGRNVIVATGTGSGKTESFLLPILFHLYKESLKGTLGPGVRALILYPMNALSNDQRDRLGAICRRLEESSSPFQFTFGQYIGATPEDKNDRWRYPEEDVQKRPSSEMVFRKQMREAPPNILLTNFSMLEYLLIRPYDSPLFDDGNAHWWNFIVLDEAHQYRGAKGMEMAMLIRRLKQRLRDGGRDGPIQSIATSATLTGGEKDRSGAAAFGSSLFGEPFGEDSILMGEKVAVPTEGAYTLPWRDYVTISDAVSSESPDASMLQKLAEKKGVPLGNPGDADPRALAGKILLRDIRTLNLQQMLSEGPKDISSLTNNLFPELAEHERTVALEDLVRAVSAASGDGGGSLLSPRFHLFIRSLEGAFITFMPERSIHLTRGTEDGAAWFELALCQNCGQHYLVGKIEGGGRGPLFVEPNRDPSHPEFGVEYLLPSEDGLSESYTGDTGPSPSSNRRTNYLLCLICRSIWKEGSPAPCEHGGDAEAVLRVTHERPRGEGNYPDALSSCLVCGHGANDPVKEVVHGSDGPNAVIATAIHENLPEERRRILAFADSRQEAAYFASYLGQTYGNIVSRGLVYRAAKKLTNLFPEGLSVKDLAGELGELLKRSGWAQPEASRAEITKRAWSAVLREFVTHEQRQSLEGVGLGYWHIKWPDWFHFPQILEGAPWNFDQTTGEAMLTALLNIMRTGLRAVAIEDLPPMSIDWSDINPFPQNRVRLGRGPKGQRNVQVWDSPAASRAKLLTKFLMHKGLSDEDAREHASCALRIIWEALTVPDNLGPDQKFLLPIGDGRQINPVWWRFTTLSAEGRIFQCSVCQRINPVDPGICPHPPCPGSMKGMKVKDLNPNHYRTLYEANLPPSMRAEEHTAQLGRRLASDYQRAFKRGEIAVLSSSTTFELGVDLGDLDTVFLRNVPPEPFNYTQRVGRAGRRAGQPGFALTYCRRSAHDLYHFARPERMLQGRSNPPVIHLKNEKILLRHMGAAVLGDFFKNNKDRFNNVEALVVDLSEPRASSDLHSYMRTHQRRLEGILLQILPETMQRPLGLDDGTWITKIAAIDRSSDPSRLNDAEDELTEDYKRASQLESDSKGKGNYKVAGWAQKRINSLAREDVLSFLSRKAIIPKYGFPVDVVALETFTDSVQLQRDRSQAISEYAPTAEVIANKKIWRSAGLKTVAGRQWPKRYYRSCTVHNRFDVWDHAQGPEASQKPCCNQMSSIRQYVIPWFGFVTDRRKQGGQTPKGRPARLFSSRPFFIGFTEEIEDQVLLPSPAKPLVSISRAAPGTMGVISEGRQNRGFFVCTECGAGSTSRKAKHRTPMGADCQGSLEWLRLGHEFVTDIVKIEFVDKAPVPSNEKLWFTYGIAFALAAAAAEVLEVPETNLSSTVGSSSGLPMPPIFIYDNVPGGAGLVSRLEDPQVFEEVLREAHERVRGLCGCSLNDSCYGCLRSYRNQFAHPRLRRGPIKAFVENILSYWGRGGKLGDNLPF